MDGLKQLATMDHELRRRLEQWFQGDVRLLRYYDGYFALHYDKNVGRWSIPTRVRRVRFYGKSMNIQG